MERRKLIVVVLLIVLLLMACGKKEETAETTKKVVIDFWDMAWGGANYPVEAAKLAEKFTETYPNLSFRYQNLPWANRYETFVTAISAKEAPDMATGGGYQPFQFAAAGEILDIGSVIDEFTDEGTIKNFDPDLIQYFKYNGVQVAIPWCSTPRYMIYRSEWFDRDGIPAPKTWDDIYNAAIHFTDQPRGVYGLVYPANASSGNVLFNTFLGTNGSGVWTEDGKNPDWINPKNVEAIKFIRKLRDAGALPPGLVSYEVNEVVQLALQDSVAMAIITGGSAGAFFADAGVQDKWKVLDVPMGPSANGKQGYVTSIEGLHAYNQTDTPEETKKALKWWAENYFELWKNKEAAVNGIPVRTDWLNDQGYLSTMADPFMVPYIKASFSKTHTLIFPATNISGWLTQNSYDAERWWTALSQAALVDPRSPEEVLREWQDKALQIMEGFGETSN